MVFLYMIIISSFNNTIH